jgi:hypothetical protein
MAAYFPGKNIAKQHYQQPWQIQAVIISHTQFLNREN